MTKHQIKWTGKSSLGRPRRLALAAGLLALAIPIAFVALLVMIAASIGVLAGRAEIVKEGA